MKEGETRIYTVPLRRGYSHKPIWKRTNAAVRTLKEFLMRHTKMVPNIQKELNEYLWIRGNKKPPARVKIKVIVKDGFAYANLEEKEIIFEEKKDKKDKKKDKEEDKKTEKPEKGPSTNKKAVKIKKEPVKKTVKSVPKKK